MFSKIPTSEQTLSLQLACPQLWWQERRGYVIFRVGPMSRLWRSRKCLLNISHVSNTATASFWQCQQQAYTDRRTAKRGLQQRIQSTAGVPSLPSQQTALEHAGSVWGFGFFQLKPTKCTPDSDIQWRTSQHR
jgi:hypothetical protein